MQATGAPLSIVINILTNAWRDNPELLGRRIVAALDQAGYEIRSKPELIPIRPNPGL